MTGGVSSLLLFKLALYLYPAAGPVVSLTKQVTPPSLLRTVSGTLEGA